MLNSFTPSSADGVSVELAIYSNTVLLLFILATLLYGRESVKALLRKSLKIMLGAVFVVSALLIFFALKPSNEVIEGAAKGAIVGLFAAIIGYFLKRKKNP